MITTTCLLSMVYRPIFDAAWIWLILSLAVFAAVFAYVRVFKTYRYKSLWLLISRLLAVLILAVILFGPSKLLESKNAVRRGNLSVLADYRMSKKVGCQANF